MPSNLLGLLLLVWYLRDSFPRNLPFLTWCVIEKLRGRNYITVKVTLVGTSPPITDLWASELVKAQCQVCQQLYSIHQSASSSSSTDSAALTVGCHVVCPHSQCFNQLLEDPEFHLSFDMVTQDGTKISAKVKNKDAERMFGCKAKEVRSNKEDFEKADKALKEITKLITEAKPTKVDLTRKDICDWSSGPLYLQNIHL